MIYLDHNATTRPLPEALEAAARASREAWANPSSLHTPGRRARLAVEDAREQLAAMVRCDSQELIFTGGGTEACNFALYGAARALGAASAHARKHLVASAIEHSAVKSALRVLEDEGWEITWVRPDSNGVVSAEAVAAALRPETLLAAVMGANNEVGTVQPFAEIGATLRARGVKFFCDMTQTLGKVEVDLSAAFVDLAAFAGHKIGAPKGAGALYARKGFKPDALVRGGGQERGLRGGTENVPGLAGFGAAAAWWLENGSLERARLRTLRDALQAALAERVPEARVNAAEVERLPNTLHVTFPGARGDILVAALDLRGVAASAGSACASGSVKPSEVLLAMGRSVEEASSSLRFSTGFGDTLPEMEQAADIVAAAYAAAR
jgi:cysteine desulfurase